MTETLQNLTKAFIGESQARNRYTFYAKIARDEGFEQIASIFEETANQEKEHAKNLFKLINELKDSDENISVETETPTIFGATVENLKAAIGGENFEHTKMYPEFADVAEKEGHQDIANRLRSIAKAEEHHEERYQKILNEVKAGTVFKKNKEVTWVCRECGYIHVGLTPPIKCPSCDHATAFFQQKCEEY
ncbi:MAG: ferritin family protein [Patescibacteria group bacterium]|jgi:rubrerythrin|nr:ferritin family protein [Patescibacteria group bacterium]